MHLGPEVDGIGAAPGSGGEGLAGEAPANDVHEPAPGLSGELADVREDGEPREAAVALTRREDPLAVGVDLDGADGAMAEQDVSEDSSANARKKVESSEGLQLRGTPAEMFAPGSGNKGIQISVQGVAVLEALTRRPFEQRLLGPIQGEPEQ